MCCYVCLHSDLFIRALDLGTKSSASTTLNLDFSLVFRKENSPQKASFYFFSQRKLAWLFILKEVKPFPDGKMMKLHTFDNLFPPTTNDIRAKTRCRMTKAVTFSRQNDKYSVLRKFRTGSRPRLRILKLLIHCKGQTLGLLHGFVYISSVSLSLSLRFYNWDVCCSLCCMLA